MWEPAWYGPLRLRPDDLLGIAVAHAGSGSSARQAAFNNAGPIDRAETAVELTWRAQVSDWLTLQPHIQYVRNPGLQPNLDDTLVAGLRFELNWSRP